MALIGSGVQKGTAWRANLAYGFGLDVTLFSLLEGNANAEVEQGLRGAIIPGPKARGLCSQAILSR